MTDRKAYQQAYDLKNKERMLNKTLNGTRRIKNTSNNESMLTMMRYQKQYYEKKKQEKLQTILTG